MHRAPCGGPQSERRHSRSRRVYARPRVRPPVKAVIPAAGLGTRFLPLTKEQPKEMLPVVDRPAIHWVVAEAVASGVTDMLIVTGREKRAIEDCVDASPRSDAVRQEKVSDYAIVAPGKAVDDRTFEVADLVEKPSPAEAPSRLGISGTYILTPPVFPAIRETKPGKNGEIQLTDALRLLLHREPIYAYRFAGRRYDIGTKMD